MKNIVVSIPNSLLSGGITLYLKQDTDFCIFHEEQLGRFVNTCCAVCAEVVLIEVRAYSPHTIEEWLTRIKEVKEKLPHCKSAFIVDENANPQLAEQVRQVRSDRLIDAFFYGAVSGEYVTAVVASL